jgi:hypothetical protein
LKMERRSPKRKYIKQKVGAQTHLQQLALQD